jgi:hypothetical protein
MSARHDFLDRFASVDVDAVWREREVYQTARNTETQLKNEPDHEQRCAMPKMQG